MNVKNLYYVEVKVSFFKTDSFDPKGKIVNGHVYIEATDTTTGKTVYVKADSLTSEGRAGENALDWLMNNMWNIAFTRLKMSKAELKRKLIGAGLISK